MSFFIPKQLYVTFQERQENKDQPPVKLGFASPFGIDAAFKKRQATQNSWARWSGKYSRTDLPPKYPAAAPNVIPAATEMQIAIDETESDDEAASRTAAGRGSR